MNLDMNLQEVQKFTPQKVWSNYTKIKKNQDRDVDITFFEIVNVNLVWKKIDC